MDLVIGRIGGKVILTFDFTFCNFMFGILLDNKTSAAVAAAIHNLKARLMKKGFSFGSLFPVILTDNGGEFSDVFAFEKDCSGCKESSLFFCDPHTPSQKPRVEKNHKLYPRGWTHALARPDPPSPQNGHAIQMREVRKKPNPKLWTFLVRQAGFNETPNAGHTLSAQDFRETPCRGHFRVGPFPV